VLIEDGKPRVGVWLMPDNRIDGKLEDFVAFLVQPNDTLWAYGIASIAGLPERRFRDVDETKTRMHTWLAWQDEPGIQMSHAITKGLLRNENMATRHFLTWLHAVFGP
jgi:hypothetical protein